MVVVDSSSNNPSQPILRVKYPAGSWSPGSAKPGGVLDYAFPTKTEPFEKTYPVSTEVCIYRIKTRPPTPTLTGTLSGSFVRSFAGSDPRVRSLFP